MPPGSALFVIKCYEKKHAETFICCFMYLEGDKRRARNNFVITIVTESELQKSFKKPEILDQKIKGILV